MLAVGTKVHHTGHGLGTIVALNSKSPNTYAAENLASELMALMTEAGLAGAVVNSFYNGELYPYVVQFDSGYKDVYAEGEVTELVASD